MVKSQHYALVRERGFEPPHLAIPAPQAGASTVPPLAHIVSYSTCLYLSMEGKFEFLNIP